MATNLEVIQSSPKIAVSKYATESAHLEKLRSVAQISVNHYIPNKVLKQLEEIGVAWIVDERFATKFDFACGLPHNKHCTVGLGSKLINQVVSGDRIMTFQKEFHCDYAGDIPDNILDNIKSLRSLGFENFTIHSVNPLPVEWKEVSTLLSVREIPKPDPVLIAWYDAPAICVDKKGKFVKMTKGFGVLAGIWDGELS